MQITSNYYRRRMQHSGFTAQLLTLPDAFPQAAASSGQSNESLSKPLSPSTRTLRDLAALHKSENQV
ncbi:MAG: hypothetical protein VXZ83_05060 [Verrucomicrobiota bacterium]|nr:hypothetical protein [Verrucomicrobiota bacterium]